MGEILNTGISDGVRGRVGGVVFRRILGRMRATYRRNRTTKPPTEAMLLTRARFKEAAGYAKEAMTDLAVRTAYETAAKSRNSTRHAVAVADWFRPPEIGAVALGGYRGQVGDLISMKVVDDFEVRTVRVQILDELSGAVLEEGPATKAGPQTWEYRGQTVVTSDRGRMVRIIATDRPDHDASRAPGSTSAR